MPQLTPQELDQIRNSMASAEDSVVIAMIKVVLSGGIDKVHPELLRIITDEINTRGISSQMMENRERKKSKRPIISSKVSFKKQIVTTDKTRIGEKERDRPENVRDHCVLYFFLQSCRFFQILAKHFARITEE